MSKSDLERSAVLIVYSCKETKILLDSRGNKVKKGEFAFRYLQIN